MSTVSNSEPEPEGDLERSAAIDKDCNLKSFPSMILPMVIIAAVAFAVYSPSLFNGFVYDDNHQIVTNPWIKNFNHLFEIFSSNTAGMAKRCASNYYGPMMYVSYLLDYHFFGLRPLSYHLTNALFHCGDSVMIFLVVANIARGSHDSSRWYLSPPFLAGILFAAHPIHTEVVMWVSALPDLAFSFFYLLAFYLYMRYMETPLAARVAYFLSVLSFFVSTLFKEPAVTLPLIIIAYDFVVRKKKEPLGTRFKRYMPYFLVAGIYMLLRTNALHGFAPYKRFTFLSPVQLVVNVFSVFAEYLYKFFLPTSLKAFYVFHPIMKMMEPKAL
jgi:hypothetical protein